MPRFRRLLAVFTVLALAGCSDSTSPEDLYGTWGDPANSVSLTISISDATFLAPCAVGKPSLPFLSESGGNFHTNGILTIQSGAGGTPTQRLVEYRVTLHGDQMTLTVDPGPQQLGPFTLQRGVQVELPACP